MDRRGARTHIAAAEARYQTLMAGASGLPHSDILIVGAGSAGSILAERISADADCRVTVVEAGRGDDDRTVRSLTLDGLSLPIGPDSPVARHYRSRLTDHPSVTADIVRGECVGGSGAINGGYFWRARPADFDRPAIRGWSWADVEAHYRAVEDRIGVSPVAEFSSATTAFIEAATAGGYRWLPDLSFGPRLAAVPLNISGGRRSGPGAVFLAPALGRPNLTLLTGTRALRVRFEGGAAIGVEAIGPSGPVVLDASLVVLSAGAIASAQLLMLSGIGPADHLRAMGITVIADLPVGRRSWDHPELVLAAGWEASPRRPVLEAVLTIDDVEIRPYTCGFGGEQPKIGVALMRPVAHGSVALASADPLALPVIEHRYDSAASDVAALRDGVALVGEILGRTEPPAWSTSQHLCGTAPMGHEGDAHAVVDPQCRVRGVSGLRVVDGSVLPGIPSRGPHATIAMVGHRAAEFLVGHGPPNSSEPLSPSTPRGSAGA